MLETLLPLLKKPVLWQRGTELFWDDEHISKGMLEAHLNPDTDSASRKHKTIDRSAKWLSSVISAGGKILDLGCGPGLYCKRLSDSGFNVTGMDFSRRSIAYAKEHDSKTEYIYMNYLELDFISAFDAVILIYGDYAALTKPERQLLLSKIYRALKPGGLFIFDVFTDTHFKNKSNKTLWSLHENGGFWNAEPHICLEAAYMYENNTVCVDHYIIITAGRMIGYFIWDTSYTKKSLTEEVLPFGFKLKSVFDDVCGKSYTDKSQTMCFVLERGAAL